MTFQRFCITVDTIEDKGHNKKKRFYQKDRKGKNKNQHLTLTGHVSDLLMSLRTRRKGEEA
jgi:hypothetical protein